MKMSITKINKYKKIGIQNKTKIFLSKDLYLRKSIIFFLPPYDIFDWNYLNLLFKKNWFIYFKHLITWLLLWNLLSTFYLTSNYTTNIYYLLYLLTNKRYLINVTQKPLLRQRNIFCMFSKHGFRKHTKNIIHISDYLINWIGNISSSILSFNQIPFFSFWWAFEYHSLPINFRFSKTYLSSRYFLLNFLELHMTSIFKIKKSIACMENFMINYNFPFTPSAFSQYFNYFLNDILNLLENPNYHYFNLDYFWKYNKKLDCKLLQIEQNFIRKGKFTSYNSFWAFLNVSIFLTWSFIFQYNLPTLSLDIWCLANFNLFFYWEGIPLNDLFLKKLIYWSWRNIFHRLGFPYSSYYYTHANTESILYPSFIYDQRLLLNCSNDNLINSLFKSQKDFSNLLFNNYIFCSINISSFQLGVLYNLIILNTWTNTNIKNKQTE